VKLIVSVVVAEKPFTFSKVEGVFAADDALLPVPEHVPEIVNDLDSPLATNALYELLSG
jgi:hypothetical protein